MTCRHVWSRVDDDRRPSYSLNFVDAVRKIERLLDCVNVRPTFSQLPVAPRKQQNTLQLTTIMEIAVGVLNGVLFDYFKSFFDFMALSSVTSRVPPGSDTQVGDIFCTKSPTLGDIGCIILNQYRFR